MTVCERAGVGSRCAAVTGHRLVTGVAVAAVVEMCNCNWTTELLGYRNENRCMTNMRYRAAEGASDGADTLKNNWRVHTISRQSSFAIVGRSSNVARRRCRHTHQLQLSCAREGEGGTANNTAMQVVVSTAATD
jgi:hypothetical protein